MNQNMTIGQLARATRGNEERIFISSLYDVSHDIELTMELRAFSGIMNLEILTLSYHEDGFVAIVDLPAEAVAALGKPE